MQRYDVKGSTVGRSVHVYIHTYLHTHDTCVQRYDLKGSTVGRSVSEEDRNRPTVILKDLDFLTNHSMLQMGPERKNLLITQVCMYVCVYVCM